jgi:hypothetical protein
MIMIVTKYIRDRGKLSGQWFRVLVRVMIPLVAAFMVVMIPWWIRNFVDFHRVVFTSTEVGNPLLLGADPYFRVGQYRLLAIAQASHQSLQSFSMHYILEGFKTHFFLFLSWYTVGKIPYFFFSPWIYGNVWIFVQFHRILAMIGIVCALVGLRMRTVRILAVTSLALLIPQFAFLPTERYVFPLMVLWCILIPTSLYHWWLSKWGRKRMHTESHSTAVENTCVITRYGEKYSMTRVDDRCQICTDFWDREIDWR